MGAKGYSKLFLKLKFADYFRAETIQEILTYATAGAHKATRVMTFDTGPNVQRGRESCSGYMKNGYFPYKSIN